MPGGDLPDADFDGWLRQFQSAHAWLPAPLAHHYGRLYGTRAVALLEDASEIADLGQHFGGLLYEREARFLVRHEWAETAEDILTRRTKHGLHLTATEAATFTSWLAAQSPSSLARLSA